VFRPVGVKFTAQCEPGRVSVDGIPTAVLSVQSVSQKRLRTTAIDDHLAVGWQGAAIMSLVSLIIHIAEIHLTKFGIQEETDGII
jgi:hypothetical protein